MKYKILITLILINLNIFSQEIPEHISSTGIYDFMDELSLLGIVDLNDVVKPYSDKDIYLSLQKAKIQSVALNSRQLKELEFYLKEYAYFSPSVQESDVKIPVIGKLLTKYNLTLSPPGYRYRDSLFYLELRPIWGMMYYKNAKKTNYHRWGGGLLKMSIGKHLSGWASLRDNNLTELFNRKEYLTLERGGNFKGSKSGGGDFSEMRGGIGYSWDWGSISMVKDHVEWGTNYHGANILSSKAPSYAQLKLHLKPVKWFDFNYMHGWLVSNVIDSSRSYTTANGNRRDVMHPKYIAANMFSLIPFEKVYFSFGNSIIYSDMSPNPGYMIPFMFFKSVDHWLNSTDKAGIAVGQNSQMFLNLSVKRFKHFNLYATVFFDELKIGRIKKKGEYNPIGYKVGVKNSNGILKNLSVIAEFTHTRPIVYEHYISTTTFQSNGYNIGHYLRSNSDELYFSIAYKPLARLLLKGEYTKARHGRSYEYIKGSIAVTYPFMQEVRWTNEVIALNASYEFAFNSYLRLTYQFNNATGEDVKLFTPDFYQGKNRTFSFGFNLGF